jgi:5'-3' exonuclease
MGIPKFYKSLKQRYSFFEMEGNKENLKRVDHFYIDMNGIFYLFLSGFENPLFL